jgi:uncharacterized protein YxjI
VAAGHSGSGRARHPEESASGEELFKVREKKLRLRDTMDIERSGHTAATIKEALVAPLRDRFAIEVKDGGELSAKGNVVDYEYERDGQKIAEISKRWFRICDTHGIAPGEYDALILAAVVCIVGMVGR